MHCGLSSSILGLYPLDARSTPMPAPMLVSKISSRFQLSAVRGCGMAVTLVWWSSVWEKAWNSLPNTGHGDKIVREESAAHSPCRPQECLGAEEAQGRSPSCCFRGDWQCCASVSAGSRSASEAENHFKWATAEVPQGAQGWHDLYHCSCSFTGEGSKRWNDLEGLGPKSYPTVRSIDNEGISSIFLSSHLCLCVCKFTLSTASCRISPHNCPAHQLHSWSLENS